MATDPVSSTSPSPGGRPARSGSPVRFLFGTVIIVSAVAWLAFSSFEEQVFYHTVGEALAQHEELSERQFRIKGDVVPGSHLIREGTLDQHIFRIVDGEYAIDVSFNGILPDTFSDNAEVIALGRMAGPDRFEAVEVMAKCASRYEGMAPTAGSGAPFVGAGGPGAQAAPPGRY